MVEEITWGAGRPTASRTGGLTMTLPGQPVTMRGTLQLAAGGPGTVAELTGELKVAIPLLGKKLEQSSAPAVLAGFRTQQKVGDAGCARCAARRHSGCQRAALARDDRPTDGMPAERRRQPMCG